MKKRSDKEAIRDHRSPVCAAVGDPPGGPEAYHELIIAQNEALLGAINRLLDAVQKLSATLTG